MKKLTSCLITQAFLFSLLAPLAGSAQQPRSAPPSPPAQTTPPPTTPPAQSPTPDDSGGGDDDVVRITTNLVQVDAVVVDKKGKQVTDLMPDDFEIFEDKRPQKLTNFSYVLTESAPPAAATETAGASRRPADKTSGVPPAPPPRLRPEQVRRTMALVVDDLGLSFESTAFVREALRRFVNEQMQANDLVAIIRTSAGVGALQQFTSDKRQLHAAIERVKWFMNGRGGVSAFAPLRGGNANLMDGARGGEAVGGRSPRGNDNDGEARTNDDVAAELEDFREEIFAVGTLGALNFVVRGMRELPGRKSVLLLSDGFALFTPERGRGRSDRVLQSLRQLTDLANRASVVVYSIDARGLVVPGLSAADDVSGMTPQQIEDTLRDRGNSIFDTQSGLAYLSEQTGGFLIKNNNDLTGGIRRVVEDQKGYYLLGYRPDNATFDRRYHRISVRVKRPGLRVRTRTGFFGVSDENTRPSRRTRDQQLLAAITSPFASPEIRLRLTTFFGNTAEDGSFMRSMLYLDGNDVKFKREPDGKYKAVLDVVGVTFGDNGRVVESTDRIYTLTLAEDLYRKMLRDGLTYTMNVPVKKAGAYQLRMAVRDAATERTGSASQFIEVPDLKKNRLALSGLVVMGAGQAQAQVVPAASSSASASATGNGAEADTPASPAVRRFRQNSRLALAYAVYNARLDKTSARPQLTAETRIYRDGQLIFDGAEQPIGLDQPDADVKRLGVLAQFQLGAQLTPGEYVLQIIVTDRLRNDKRRVATQWIDFEVVK
ncbi:MAG TPA: VWA domain-containing protein [Pyrinomonadaceae bacterium]|nr:VWA domain-containing protein [Pyrinomonadaceae bacterium]